jgi:DNA (cytosine-5)-methyltransferase 1
LTGGFALAARWAGIETIQFVEIDPFCQKVLRKNFKGVSIHDDIKTFKWTGERPFILTGGFPCQDLSIAGKQKGFCGKRSSLYTQMLRIVSESRPQYIIFENVTNLLAGEYGRWFARFLYDLASVRYDAQWHCIPASSLNAPHFRDRIFIVAYANSIEYTEQNESRQWELARQLNRAFISGRKKRWEAEPDILRMVDGIPNQMDRLKSLGNAIVPQVAFAIMQAIIEVENKNV